MAHEPAALPLTGAQAGIWLAQQLAPTSPVYNTADAVELTGPIDPEQLARHIRAVLNEAEALHVRVIDGPGGPVQRRATAAWPLPIVDLRRTGDPRAAAGAYMEADLGEPVELAADPLFATALLRTGDDTWTWYLRIHHIATDAYATALLMRRVAERMSARAGARGGREAKPFGTLAELVDAEAAYRASDAYLADRAFWATRLAGHVAPATLAGVAVPAAPRPFRAETVLDARTGAALAAAGTAAGAGWPELVMAAFGANLASITGSRRQVLAMPVLARKGTARRTPGVCVNVVPLAVEVDPTAALSAAVAAIRDELRALRPHHGLRFEELQRMLPDGGALFGPQVNLKPYVRELRFGEASARIRNLATGPVDDLSLIVTDLPGGSIELTLDGNPALYDQAAVDAQLSRLVVTLQACAEPGAIDRPTGALPTLTASERAQVVTGCNATAHPIAPTTLVALLRAQAERTPDAIAVSDARESITYAELHRRAEALATELLAAGAGPGAIVGLGLHRSVGLSIAVVATLLAGAAYLPLDLDLPSERLAYLLGDASPVAIVTNDDAATALPAHEAPILTIDAGGTGTWRPKTPVSGRFGRQVGSAGGERAAGPQPRDAAYVLYTSGSTGRPKGVVVEHAAIVNRLAWMQATMPIGPSDAVLQKTPFGFDVSVWELVWPLLHGARLVMAEPGGHRDPAYLASLIREEAITTLHFVPSMLDLFLEEPLIAASCLSVRQIICSGEALSEATVNRYHAVLGAPLYNLYGPTEAAIDVTWWPCRASDAPGPVPIGRPVWNTRTYVLDEARRPVPVGSPGELWLAGDQLARGYLNRQELTAERFITEPFAADWAAAGAPLPPGARMYRTGDLARWRADGALDYLGRTDDQVKLRGQRIELGEIEATLARHPAVVRAAASVDRDGGPPRIVAHLVATEPATPALRAAVLAQAAAALPDAMVPSAVAFVDELPLSPNGKLDRRQLPAIARPGHGADARAPSRAPRTPREQQLCELFAEATGRAMVGPDENLFELGGDSLLAARLAAQIRARLAVNLQLGAIFAAPTPAALATRIDDGASLSALDPLLTLRAAGDAPPLCCFHPAGGLGWCYAGLARTIDDRPLLAIQAPPLTGQPFAATLADQARRYADLIEARAPAGPLHLLGWSVGGVLAHAAAHALQQRGRETGIVALLDAYPGEQWAHRPPPTAAETLRALLYMGGLDETALLGSTPGAVSDSADPTLASVLSALTSAGSALASLGQEALAAVAQSVRDSSRLMREHSTPLLSGDLLFFGAAAPRREDWLDAAAWRRYVSGEVHQIDLPVTHPEIPRRGPIDTIGEVVAQALRDYPSRSPASRSSTVNVGAALSSASDPT